MEKGSQERASYPWDETNSILKRLFNKKKGAEEKFEKIKKLISELYKTEPDFAEHLHTTIPDDGKYHGLHRHPMWHGKEHNALLSLLWDCDGDFFHNYGRCILIKWLDFGKRFDIRHSIVPRVNYNGEFVIEDGVLRVKNIRAEAKEESLDDVKWFLNLININDKMEFDVFNPLHRLFDLTIGLPPLPTVVKYSRRKMKMLWVFLPELLNMTTFQKEFLKHLSRIHNEFYGAKFKGAPRQKDLVKIAIQEALESYRGKNFSMNKLYQLVGEKIRKSPRTLERSYKKVFQEFKEKGGAENTM